jgi:GTPase SAR1 family protein
MNANEKEDTEELFTKEVISLYQVVFNEIFGDLQEIDNIDKSIFLSFFVGRNNQISEIMPHIRSFKNNELRKKTNILIKGKAGVGKTTLMLRLLREPNLFDNELEYIFLDFNKATGIRNDKGFLLELIKKMESFFINSGYPIHTFDDINNIAKLEANFQALISHLNTMENKNLLKKKLVLIIDDLDYADHYWKDILDQVIRFADFSNILLIINARPPLVHDIEKTSDKFRIKFTKQVKKITLEPIEILNLITSRISIFLCDEKVKQAPTGIFSRILSLLPMYKEKHPVDIIVNKTGICTADDLLKIKGKLDIYFTEEDIQLIYNMTNGNIREIFYMTQTILLYILENYNSLEKHSLHGVIIPRKKIIKLFLDENETFYFINILKNSELIYNLLVFFEENQKIDKQGMLKIRKKTKATTTDINDAINVMLDPFNRLICPISTNYFTEKGLGEFEITTKGKYYLTDIYLMDEYREIFKNL